jgi:hypothetical protein
MGKPRNRIDRKAARAEKGSLQVLRDPQVGQEGLSFSSFSS